MTIIRTYSELITRSTFIDRFNYLRLDGVVGKETFGYDRYLNQALYRSKEWKHIRAYVIARDYGCDLAIKDRSISGRVYVHHMNPITLEDFDKRAEALLNPEFLITVSFDTHNAIHYSDESLLILPLEERREGDTCPWKTNLV